MLGFGLLEALLGRRSRRFFMGAEIPDGVFAYKSRYPPLPLTELEKLLVVTACGGNTGWHYMIQRAQRYAPHLANYAGAAGGRTFPSAAGFHTTVTFFTDDEGVYMLDVRDAPALIEKDRQGKADPGAVVEALKSRVRKIQLPGYARGGGGALRAEIRAWRPVSSGHAGTLEGVAEGAVRRPAARPRVSGVRGAPGAVHFRYVREVSGHDFVHVCDDLSPGATPGS